MFLKFFNLNKFLITKDNFIITKNKIQTQKEPKSIDLISKEKLKSGWYLWGFKQISNNKKCYSFLINGIFGFKQGRVMSPGKIRWRVVHLKKNDFCTIKICGIEKPLSSYFFFFLRIFPIDAWRRIFSRCSIIQKKMNKDYLNVKNKKRILWKKYNNILLSNTSNNFDYIKWQNTIEKNFLKKIVQLTNNLKAKYKFFKIYHGKFDLVEDEYDYVVP